MINLCKPSAAFIFVELTLNYQQIITSKLFLQN